MVVVGANFHISHGIGGGNAATKAIVGVNFRRAFCWRSAECGTTGKIAGGGVVTLGGDGIGRGETALDAAVEQAALVVLVAAYLVHRLGEGSGGRARFQKLAAGIEGEIADVEVGDVSGQIGGAGWHVIDRAIFHGESGNGKRTGRTFAKVDRGIGGIRCGKRTRGIALFHLAGGEEAAAVVEEAGLDAGGAG